ncbi:MAG TPA: 2,3,4,5-tetrahydropyridine-2,6-dicarboxylate N-succinyltransferase [Candidatus Cloacimonetes bacterium]|nr:2,3,4,5-tetrahydropyridine-2,6-dicarboxylate N-succinyltransferase [Candidatus Cloacimonadota bacterium]
MVLKDRIIQLYQNPKKSYDADDFALFDSFLQALNSGQSRACEKEGDIWIVNQWVKMGILIGFRIGELAAMPAWGENSFFEKHTMPQKEFSVGDQVRIVPGGSSIRTGAYIASGVTIMPPSYINIGAWVDSGTMVDSHALVGSCAQIGKRVHLSAGAMIGGVLEPIGTRPVVIEDDAFIGGNTGIYEGIMIREKAVIAAGTILTKATSVYDSVNKIYLPRDEDGVYTIPAGAVVVPGSRALKADSSHHVYCPIIIKYRDEKTDAALTLEDELRILA